MNFLKIDETDTYEGNDFMFYGSYRDAVELIRRQDEAAAGKLCMAIIRLGVRGEFPDDLPSEQRAFLKSIAPLIQRSKEKKEETAKALKRIKHKKPQVDQDPSKSSTDLEKEGQSRDDRLPSP